MRNWQLGLVTLAVFLGLNPGAHSQDRATLSCKSVPAADVQFVRPPHVSGRLRVNDLLPTKVERSLGSIAIGYEILDQPDFYAVTQDLPVPPTQEPRKVITFINSPDQYLWKTTLTLSPAQLFLSPADLKLGYGSLAEKKDLFDLDYDRLSAQEDLLSYFARRRGRDLWARALSTLTISAAVAQRPQREGDGQLPPVIFGKDETVETYGLKFDPVPLFPTGSELVDALSALSAYAKVYGRTDFMTGADLCGKTPSRRCLREVAGISGWSRWASAALPTFEFKSVDQFDFFNAEGRFLLLPFTEKTLETYTFTWDLKRTFRLGKERAAAVTALKTFEALAAAEPVLSVRERPIIIATDELVYLQITAKDGIKDLSWSVDSGCAQDKKDAPLPGISLTSSGLLVGYPEPPLSQCAFLVKAEDAVGRAAYVGCTVEPEN